MFCLRDANENIYDRILRAFIASLLIIAGLFWFPDAWGIILYVIAAGLMINAITGVCGLYKMFGISTLKKRKEKLPVWLIWVFFAVIIFILLFGIFVRIFLLI